MCLFFQYRITILAEGRKNVEDIAVCVVDYDRPEALNNILSLINHTS